MTRKECLEQAMGCVLRDRNREYGGPEDSFGVIANFWSVYLGRKIYPSDVAMMMSLLKIARIKSNKNYADGYVDLAGYAACGAECASGNPSTSAKPEAEFKFDDEVDALLLGMGWRKGYYVRRMENGKHSVRLLDGHIYDDVEVCHHRKAEGCEELVHDAPQTPEETCQRIVDSNPATFHTPSYAEEQLDHHSRLQTHKPTGEELAEMAEEECA